MRRTVWLPILLAAALPSCKVARGGEGEPCGFLDICEEGLTCVSGVCVDVPPCDANATRACDCEDGGMGAQTCDADGAWLPCVCPEACGNGVCDVGEQFTTCPQDCEEPACGNNQCEPEENANNCDEDCDPLCGNGAVELGEVCDDGNNSNGDGCAADCGSDESCGNGITDAGEVCDDGNSVDGDGCSADCHTLETCGDGALDPGEVCDDGNNVDGDGCAADCASDESCGNGITDTGEVCDDGNNINGDGCSADCQSQESCGDAVLDPGEGCDDGNAANDDDCLSTCQTATCGDGHIWIWMEECDDGNSVDGDGCSAGCTLEPGLCGNGTLDPGEACDDGNPTSHDGCSSGCTSESLNWSPATYVLAPPPRGLHAAAFDDARSRMVVFGGLYYDGGLQTLGDTWELGGHQWYEMQPATSPSARSEAAMVYDSGRGVTVLFGGTETPGQGALGDTWEYDGVTWAQVSTATAPPARRAHAMVYDSGRGVTVLFGGHGAAAGDLLGDTWEYDGSDWVEASPTSTPPARQSHAMAYNEAIGMVMVFGGSAGGYPFDDTWTYEGARWSQVWTSTTPTARSYHAMTYDAGRGRTVLFGGHDYILGPLSESWEFESWSWNTTTPTEIPTTWLYHSLVYDSSWDRVLIFGGYSNSTYLNTVWEYKLDSAWPDETCHNGLDDDGDSVIDCADPDCEGKPCVSGTCTAGVCL